MMLILKYLRSHCHNWMIVQELILLQHNPTKQPKNGIHAKKIGTMRARIEYDLLLRGLP